MADSFIDNVNKLVELKDVIKNLNEEIEDGTLDKFNADVAMVQDYKFKLENVLDKVEELVQISDSIYVHPCPDDQTIKLVDLAVVTQSAIEANINRDLTEEALEKVKLESRNIHNYMDYFPRIRHSLDQIKLEEWDDGFFWITDNTPVSLNKPMMTAWDSINNLNITAQYYTDRLNFFTEDLPILTHTYEEVVNNKVGKNGLAPKDGFYWFKDTTDGDHFVNISDRIVIASNSNDRKQLGDWMEYVKLLEKRIASLEEAIRIVTGQEGAILTQSEELPSNFASTGIQFRKD